MELGQVILDNWIHYFQVLNINAGKGSIEIQVLLDGITRTLIKQQNDSWCLKQANDAIQNELIQLVGSAIATRFRISNG